MDSVVHFEMPYEKRDRVARFVDPEGHRVSLLQPVPVGGGK